MSVWNNAVPGRDEQFVRKREALLRAAAQSFNRRGYHGTSLTDIAKKLGVTKAALYTYVPSKEELLYYCHDSAMDAGFEALEQGRTRGGNGLEKLTITLMGYLELMLSQEASFVLLMEEHAMRPAHVFELHFHRCGAGGGEVHGAYAEEPDEPALADVDGADVHNADLF